MRRSVLLRESRPVRSAFLAKIHERQPPRIASLARTAAEVRDEHFARLPRHTSSAAESGVTCRWHGAPAKASCGEELKSERLARRHRHEHMNHQNLHCRSPRQRFSWLSACGAFTNSLSEYNWESRPTRPQHPTACRSVARRLRRLASARRCASRCWNREARGWVSGRTLGGYAPNVRRDKQCGRHQRTLIVFAAACWQQRRSARGLKRRSASLRESRRRVQRSVQRIPREFSRLG
jgi:hypothetical protein